MISPDFWEVVRPFLTPAGFMVALGALVKFWDNAAGWWRTTRDDRKDEEERRDRRDDLKAMREREADLWSQMKARLKALEEQHDYDMKSIADYQRHMVDCHEEIMKMRGRIEELCRFLGVKVDQFEPLPSLPQPSLMPPCLPE